MNDGICDLAVATENPGITAVAVPKPVLSDSIRPRNAKLLFGAQAPDNEASWHHSKDRAHSFGFCVQGWVTKKASDKVRRLILAHRQNDQAIPGVTEGTRSKAQVASEECRTRKGQQEGRNVFVGHAFAAQFEADLPDGNIPAAQPLALAFQNILVQDVHIPCGELVCLDHQFMGVFPERLPRHAHRFRDGLLVDAAAPFLDDAFPGHSGGHLFQHVRHENSSAPKGGLPVTNLWISNDVTAHHFLWHDAAMHTPPSASSQRQAGRAIPTDN